MSEPNETIESPQAVDAVDPQVEIQESRPRAPAVKTDLRRKLTDEQVAQALVMAKDGHRPAFIASQMGVTRQAIGQLIEKHADTRELAIKYLQAKALRSVKLWSKAAEISALKGRHSASKELAEAAMPELRPISGQTGSSILIAIGQPGAALEPPTITVSPLPPQVKSETTPDH